MEIKVLSGYDLINRIKHDLALPFYNTEKKKLHNILENHLASFKHQINIFTGLSMFFDELSRKYAVNSTSASKQEAEQSKLFFDNLIENSSNFIYFSEKYKKLATKSKDYADLLQMTDVQANKSKELIFFGKYFTNLFEYEKQIEKQKQNCFHFMQKFYLIVNDASKKYELDRLEKELWNNFMDLKVIHLKNYNDYLRIFDSVTYRGTLNTLREINKDSTEMFHFLLVSYIDCLNESFTNKKENLNQHNKLNKWHKLVSDKKSSIITEDLSELFKKSLDLKETQWDCESMKNFFISSSFILQINK